MISIYVIENEFGSLVLQELSNKRTCILPEDQVVLIQMDDIAGDPIVNCSDGKTARHAISRSVNEGMNVVGYLVDCQHSVWSLVDEYGY